MEKPTIHVTCAIIQNGGKVFVAQRSAQMRLPLKWEFPGGKIDVGETEEQCIVRELKEELGITVEVIKRMTAYEHEYEHSIVNLIPFIVSHKDGAINLTEHAQYIWADLSTLTQLDWAPADVPILNDYIIEYGT